ncbi:transmembrane reductase CYB561D2-like [Zophobas morio]|uniref:transmembrane reductase CYB561D2-like n=1 Tax=Zophobas morio TaxID=2755281 RepID=UPI0030831731
MTADGISITQRLSWTLNIIFHQAVAVITVYILTTVFASSEVNSLGTWHMVLTPLGIMLLMMESLILFTKDNIYTLHMPRTKKHYIHSSLQILSTILITTGIAFRIKSKSGHHFTTTHGILGLSAWVLIWCSVFLGIATSQSQVLKRFVKPVWIKLCHTLMGVSGFTLGVVTLGYGLKEYFGRISHEKVIIAAIVTMAILYAWALLDTVKSIYNQIRNILGK